MCVFQSKTSQSWQQERSAGLSPLRHSFIFTACKWGCWLPAGSASSSVLCPRQPFTPDPQSRTELPCPCSTSPCSLLLGEEGGRGAVGAQKLTNDSHCGVWLVRTGRWEQPLPTTWMAQRMSETEGGESEWAISQPCSVVLLWESHLLLQATAINPVPQLA